jgi:hypothetical protein
MSVDGNGRPGQVRVDCPNNTAASSLPTKAITGETLPGPQGHDREVARINGETATPWNRVGGSMRSPSLGPGEG